MLVENRFYTSAEIRALEMNAEALGISQLQMMESAGFQVANFVANLLKNEKRKDVIIFSYIGNKGGDGFVCARYLATMGINVNVILLGSPSEIKSNSARQNWKILREISGEKINIRIIRDSLELKDLEDVIAKCSIIIDAILGIGIKGEIKGLLKKCVEEINAHADTKKIISIDIPTGLSPNSGEILGISVKPHYTLTMHGIKIGMHKKKNICGEIKVLNIGIPKEAYTYVGPGDVFMAVKKREKYSHKGDFGRIIVIGGSKLYSGAPALVGLAALRAGADLVKIITPKCVASVIRSYSPDLIVIPSGETFIRFDESLFKEEIKKCDCVAIGPGLSLYDGITELIENVIALVRKYQKKIVIDADGLKALADILQRNRIFMETDNFVLTPHAGEFGILRKKETPPEIAFEERKRVVKEFAKRYNCVILLKGHWDIISDGNEVKINRTGTPAMTVGGTGDVLTGIVATLLAWRNRGLLAACAGAYINGLAGEYAEKDVGFHLTASELIKYIPEVMKRFDKK